MLLDFVVRGVRGCGDVEGQAAGIVLALKQSTHREGRRHGICVYISREVVLSGGVQGREVGHGATEEWAPVVLIVEDDLGHQRLLELQCGGRDSGAIVRLTASGLRSAGQYVRPDYFGYQHS